jgi:hypothetical protein
MEMISENDSAHTNLESGTGRLSRRSATIAHDMFYRPSAFENLCLWDMHCLYQNTRKPKTSTSRTEENIHLFQSGHPQAKTDCMKRRTGRIIPVFLGYPVPRRDRPEVADRYAATVLSLFKPWSRDQSQPVKHPDTSWEVSVGDFLKDGIKLEHVRVLDHMQEAYECKNAKDDYAADRRPAIPNFVGAMRGDTDGDDGGLDDMADDPVWNLAWFGDNSEDYEDAHPEDLCFNQSASAGEQRAIELAELAGFYKVDQMRRESRRETIASSESQVTLSLDVVADEHLAKLAMDDLMDEKARLLESRTRSSSSDMASRSSQENNRTDLQCNSRDNTDAVVPDPCLSTLSDEREKARLKFARFGRAHIWEKMQKSQQLAASLVEKLSLNAEQCLAFLLVCDRHIASITTPVNIAPEPLLLMIGGPGGTGKSQIFEAIKEFFSSLGHRHRLKITASTGVAATNIGGGTIYSEASLLVSKRIMESNGGKAREKLEERWQNTDFLIVDEISFLGCGKMSRL